MKRFTLIIISLLICALPVQSQNIDSVDTPYTKDEHTRLLLHFDGEIETDLKTTVYGDVTFTESAIDSFGKMAGFDNDDPDNTEYISIQDHNRLNLQGSWTIETWFTLWGPPPASQGGCTQGGSSYQVLWSKAGDDSSSINYRTYLEACDESITVEYTPSSRDKPARFTATDAPVTLIHHLAVIRNAAAKQLTLLVHQLEDNKVQLAYKKSWDIAGDSIATNSSPLQIGRDTLPQHPSAIPLGINGYIDEFRISDTVRTYARSTDIEDPGGIIPEKIKLKQNYPNPFNPSTNIRFSLPQSEQVTINVYNSIGKKVETLVNRQLTAGSHSITFNAEGLPSGVYIYRLKAGEYSESRKMLLLR